MTLRCLFKGHNFEMYDHWLNHDRKVLVCLKCGKRKTAMYVSEKVKEV